VSVPSHIRGHTVHNRHGSVQNSFRYSLDYLCVDLENDNGPILFSRDRFNLFSVHTSDHGGAPKKGRGAAWVREVLRAHDIGLPDRIVLVTQARVLGHVFNPVSFWFCLDNDGDPRVVIAEVSNTFGDRHSYLCRHEDGAKIAAQDTLSAQKVFHVSPFQPVSGDYSFRFEFGKSRFGAWIDYHRNEGGVYATLTGARKPLTNHAILWACVRRPFGSRRVLGLIHWQALKLWWKGARYRARPLPPSKDVSG